MPPLRPPCVQRADLVCSRVASHLACWGFFFQLLQLCLSSGRSVRAYALPSLPSSVWVPSGAQAAAFVHALTANNTGLEVELAAVQRC
jgi:hypothetical protein